MTKDQLIQYLRVCADLADAPKDGVAHVAIVPLRQAIQLLESSAEPKAEPADLGPCLGMEQELRECRRDLGLLAAAGFHVREAPDGHRFAEIRGANRTGDA